MHSNMYDLSVYFIDASRTKVTACMSRGRIEVFPTVSGAVIDAKFVITPLADSAVISIAYIRK